MAASDPETALRQTEEIEALSAIYGDEWCAVDEDEKIFCIKISDCLEQPKWTLCLQVSTILEVRMVPDIQSYVYPMGIASNFRRETYELNYHKIFQVILPPEYPTAAPPIYQLNAPWPLGQQEYAELANNLEEIYAQNPGDSILYLWVEKVREFLIKKSQSCDSGPDIKRITEENDVSYEEDFSLEYQPFQECTSLMQNFDLSQSQEEEDMPPIHHGNAITDRRSTFQAHLAPVVSPKQVKEVLTVLYENKKIANATHNIYAYRIYCEDKQTFLQDCEDDGETAAGGRLLHLLQILNVRNVLVVVSRWYGGILLGPDRFKHINNCARNILVEQKYTASSEHLSKQLEKCKKIRKDKKKTEQ